MMFEGKAIRGMTRRRERAVCGLIEDMGGGRDLQGDALNASDDLVFDRALDLAGGRAEPSAGEADAVERFQRRAGECG